jgi:hypothetical protein
VQNRSISQCRPASSVNLIHEIRHGYSAVVKPQMNAAWPELPPAGEAARRGGSLPLPGRAVPASRKAAAGIMLMNHPALPGSFKEISCLTQSSLAGLRSTAPTPGS